MKAGEKMQVIFIKDLKKQGKKGEIKEVKDGYAENFLIKNGYAVKKSATSMKILEQEQENARRQDELSRKQALETKEKLEKETIVFQVKTGEHDKVFGSISAKQIKERLKDYKVDKKQIILNSPLSTIGFHEVEIVLYKDIKAKVKVQLTK